VHSQRDLSQYALNPDELREKKKELLRLGGTRDQIVKALKSAILKPDQREQFKKPSPFMTRRSGSCATSSSPAIFWATSTPTRSTSPLIIRTGNGSPPAFPLAITRPDAL
jgi:hypothetical protein